jgi:LPS O-antigen subunit length determinant protein (WzzB/FepE family)
MDAVTKPPQVPRSTDRIMEALATLAALLDRTINEVKNLDGEFQARLLDAVHKTEESLQVQTAEYVELTREEVHQELSRRFQSELQTALDTLRSDFQTERERLSSEFSAERERLGKELRFATDASSVLQVERSKLVAEVQRLKESAAAELERVRGEAEASIASATSAHAVSNNSPHQLPQDEIAQIEKKLAGVIEVIDDPATELSVVIRKNVEKLELEAYLKGLRYAVGKGK